MEINQSNTFTYFNVNFENIDEFVLLRTVTYIFKGINRKDFTNKRKHFKSILNTEEATNHRFQAIYFYLVLRTQKALTPK